MEIIKAKPTISNTDIVSADTEYSNELPQYTKEFWLKLRTIGYNLQVAMVEAESDTTYFTIRSGEVHKEKDIKNSKVTLYFLSPQASMVAEIISFK